MRTPPLILIVDDNPANVEILQARLAANDYEIITASDGEAGLAMARDRLPDLILLDIMMPKMDGIEVCRHLRADSTERARYERLVLHEGGGRFCLGQPQ